VKIPGARPPARLGIAGPSGSGKTTLIVKLLPILSATGLVVSTVKHVHHPVEIDTPGKDSFRHREAGAHEVMIALPDGWVLHHPSRDKKRPGLDEAMARMSPCDLVLVEGFRDMPLPRIQLFELEANPRAVLDLEAPVVAVVGTQKPEGYAVQAFARDDIVGIAAFVAMYARRTRGAAG
jgi:molybdopterin-guanine dinucleotide biosynthesis protein B